MRQVVLLALICSSIKPMSYENCLASVIRSPHLLALNIRSFNERHPYIGIPTTALAISSLVSPISITITQDVLRLLKNPIQLIDYRIPTCLCLAGASMLVCLAARELHVQEEEAHLSNQLCWQAEDGDLGAVKELLYTKRVNPRCRNTSSGYVGNSPLHHAASRGHMPIIDELLRAGADINARTLNEWTPLMHMVDSRNIKDDNHEQIIREFLKRKPDIEARNAWQDNALLMACRKINGIGAFPLLEAGAQVDVKDQDGRTPLYWARETKNEILAKALLAREAK